MKPSEAISAHIAEYNVLEKDQDVNYTIYRR